MLKMFFGAKMFLVFLFSFPKLTPEGLLCPSYTIIRVDLLSKSRNLVVRKFKVNIPLPRMKIALGIIYSAESTAPWAGRLTSDLIN